jgi:segregation and condensation protein A
MTRVASLDLDLEVFQGPFDLLLTLVLREEVDLLEVDLAEVVLAYVEHLERSGQIDLEAATEFLVLIAALLELKSRLMLPGDEDEGLDWEPQEAAEELLARMLEYARYRRAADFLAARLAVESGFRYRSAPIPRALRRVSLEVAEQAYEPDLLARAIGDLLRTPAPLDLRHMARPRVTVEQRLRHLRELLRSRGRFAFAEAIAGSDRLTQAITLFALLELYKAGEADWEQRGPFEPVTVSARAAGSGS